MKSKTFFRKGRKGRKVEPNPLTDMRAHESGDPANRPEAELISDMRMLRKPNLLLPSLRPLRPLRTKNLGKGLRPGYNLARTSATIRASSRSGG